MKKSKNILSIAFVALLAMTVLLNLTGCKKISLDDQTSIINTAIYTSPVLVQFQNANSTSTTNPRDAEFPVTITGPGAQYVVASDGGTVFKASHGILALALLQTGMPSTSSPVTFSVNATIPGFAPITQSITITDTTVTTVTVSALEFANPIDGVAITPTMTSPLSAGTSSGATLNTNTNATMTEKATIKIAPNTQMKDENGNVINASTLSTNIVQYGTGSPNALGVFPGTVEPKNVIGPDGTPVKGGVNFVTAGLLAMDMTADGKKVKSFSQPLDVTMELNSSLTNFNTQMPMQAGDSIPVWSLNQTTGQWKYESVATVVDNGSGKLAANFKAPHLSCWNLDWGWSYFGGYGSKPNPLKVTITTSSNPAFIGYPYEVVLADPNGRYLGANHQQQIFNGYTCTFPYTPNIPQAKIQIIKDWWSYGPVVAQTALFNPSTKGSVTVNFTPPAPPDYINLKMNISGKCSNKNTSINVGTWVYFWPADGAYSWTDFQYCYVATNGWTWNNPVRLKANTRYYVATWYGGVWNQNIIELKKQDYLFPTTTVGGAVISGSAKYTSTNNTLTVSAAFAVMCR